MSDKWAFLEPVEWDSRQYKEGDQVALTELRPSMALDEALTELYLTPTFSYTVEVGYNIVNGKKKPNFQTRHVKFPLKKV